MPILIADYILHILLILVCAWLLAYLIRSTYRKHSGGALVLCPESQSYAAVRIDGWHALLTSFGGSPEIRLKWCSRWKQRGRCAQPCTGQISKAPENCMVRDILQRWYSGENCALCGQSLTENAGEPLCFMTAEGETDQWDRVPIERVRDALPRCRPICADCHASRTILAFYLPEDQQMPARKAH